MGFEKDIQARTRQFAVRVLGVVRALPQDTIGLTVGRQIAKSGTSVGANIEEAQGAQTKREFSRKMSIARGEMFETRYWLRLMVEAKLLPARRLKGLIEESDELVRVLTAIFKRSRGG